MYGTLSVVVCGVWGGGGGIHDILFCYREDSPCSRSLHGTRLAGLIDTYLITGYYTITLYNVQYVLTVCSLLASDVLHR